MEGILQNLVQIVHKDTVLHGVTVTVFGPIMSASMHKVQSKIETDRGSIF